MTTNTHQYGIWRTEARARVLKAREGFLRDPVTGEDMRFDSVADAIDFLKTELAQGPGADYQIVRA
jgi:hypothetical protein